jgi:DNA-binding transcriptional regulator YiaG
VRNHRQNSKNIKRQAVKPVPRPIRTLSPERITGVRRNVRLNRERFATVMNVDVGLLRKWESGAEPPAASAVALFEILEGHPRLALVIDAQLSEHKKWRMPITKTKLQSITDDELLIDAIILGRFVSSLRALLQADDQYEHDEHPARWRARWSSFILAAGILNEALSFTNHLAGRYKGEPAWTTGFGPMLKTLPQWFRDYVRAVRHKGAFHFDDRAEVARRLAWLRGQSEGDDFDFDFVSGEGFSAQSVYYPFPDLLITVGPMKDMESLGTLTHVASKYMTTMRTVLSEFVISGDGLMKMLLLRLGFTVTYKPAATPSTG